MKQLLTLFAGLLLPTAQLKNGRNVIDATAIEITDETIAPAYEALIVEFKR